MARARPTAHPALSPGIIINADDLGMHPATNAGIASAFRDGIVSSTTLMVTTPYLTETVEQVIQPLRIPVGLHLSLTQGRPAAQPEKIPDLVGENGSFRWTSERLILAGASRRRLFEQIRIETEAQLARSADLGIKLTHIDSHQHVHMNPAIFQIVEEVAPRFGVQRIRFSREPFMPFSLLVDVGQTLRRKNQMKWLLMRWLCGRIRPRLATTDWFFGLLYSGVASKRALMALLGRVPARCSLEICVHPGSPPPSDGKPDPDVDAFTASPWRTRERDALTDGELAELMRRRGLVPRAFDGRVKDGW